MPQTMKAIQAKHEEAISDLTDFVEALAHDDDRNPMREAIGEAREAFAAAVQHHADYLTKLKVATKVAREIEDASTKGQ
jgi:gamma-glutamyl-gamma-aminobutyrate hydrolase PuuD